MTRGDDAYDVFLSYAKSDDKGGMARILADELSDAVYRRHQRKLRIFLDRQEILTADIWEDRIHGALKASRVLIAVVSQAYLRSEWCRREWDYFASAETGFPAEDGHGNIFPVLMNGEPVVEHNAGDRQRLIRDITAREFVDLAGAAPGSVGYRGLVDRLADGVAAALSRHEDGQAKPPEEPDTEHVYARTGYAGDRDRFVRLLAEARNATIIGHTNEGLFGRLEQALDLKRKWSGNPAAFWGSLRVVFFGEKLLDQVNDERNKIYPQPQEAIRWRRSAAGYGRIALANFLSQEPTSRWEILDSPYYPPFVGTLFEMADGTKLVQLMASRPQRQASDHLYLEFPDRSDEYFAGAFGDIVRNSIPDSGGGIVPVGVPQGGHGFMCTGERYRRRGQPERSGVGVWLPAAMAVTWRNRNSRPEPLLQLRRKHNNIAELNRLSHLSTYVYRNDLPPLVANQVASGAKVRLPDASFTDAVRRLVQIDTTFDLDEADSHPVRTCSYLYPDQENLYFLIFSVQLPDGLQFQPLAEIQPATVGRLLAIHGNQALRNALHLYEIRATYEISASAVEIATMNLIMHGYTEIAHEMITSFHSRRSGADEGERLATTIARREQQSRQTQLSEGRAVPVIGLAGLQYREFFTILLPLYRDIGIPGAAEALSAINADPAKRQALSRLSSRYHDEVVMAGVPVEV